MSEIKVNSIKGVGASTAAITISNTDGTATANLTNRQGKNLVVNGACNIAQRSTSSTTSGYSTVDRFKTVHSGIDEGPTYAQVDVSSGTTPYTLGFRKALRITNGNQTSGAGAADYISYAYRVEAQDIANSGWNYVSSSSNITLSFWIKSSVAQDFKGYIRTHDGTSQAYAFATGSLSADTWTKITKTISGNSNLTFNNNEGVGFEIVLGGFWGTDYTNNSVTENAWAAYASGTRMKDNTSTWYTTNDATLEITGLQLEVSDHATDFEFLSFTDELRRCQRYYYDHANGSRVAAEYIGVGYGWVSSQLEHIVRFPVPMRIGPSLVNSTGTNYYQFRNENQEIYLSDMDIDNATTSTALLYKASISGATEGRAYRFQLGNSSAYLHFNAEL